MFYYFLLPNSISSCMQSHPRELHQLHDGFHPTTNMVRQGSWACERALQNCRCSRMGMGNWDYFWQTASLGWSSIAWARILPDSKLAVCGVETLKPVQATKRASFTPLSERLHEYGQPLNNLWPNITLPSPQLLGGVCLFWTIVHGPGACALFSSCFWVSKLTMPVLDQWSSWSWCFTGGRWLDWFV